MFPVESRIRERDEDALPNTNPSKLRELASWYREFAERAGNPVIWEARRRTAQDLEAEAVAVTARMERPSEQ